MTYFSPRRFFPRLPTLVACFAIPLGIAGIPSAHALAELRPESIHIADGKKTEKYIRDGIVTGGDHAINGVVVKDIRRALNSGGFERVVIDLEGTLNGEPAAIARPPFYQVAVTPDEKRVVFTLFGKPRLAFDSKRVHRDFRKSPVVKELVLYPAMDENSWTFMVEMKAGRPVEVFELTDPARVILDIRTR